MERIPATRRHYTYVLSENGTAEYVRYTSLKGISATVPATIRRTPVTAVGPRAFAWNFQLHNVYISHGITSIGNSAFSCCVHLGKVFIPDSVTSIGDYAFDVCPRLTILVVRGSYAEWYCKENHLRYEYRNNSQT